MSARADVIVLGAGIVGVSVALHLQKRDRDVVLIDRQGAGEETSYGNAGLIQREAVIPYTFPRELSVILSYAMNHRRDAVYHLSALPRIAPWLFRYWQNATPERVERSARALAPLMAQCVDEHEALITEAGGTAQSLVHRRGWLNCCRTEKSLRKAIEQAHLLDKYGVDYAVLTGAQLRQLEPHVSEAIVGAIHFRGSPTSSDPGMLTKAYADLFTHKGGRFLKGDARRLAALPSGWSVVSEKGSIEAREAVVALGPWSDLVFEKLGYALPFAVKRGYHLHLAARGNAGSGRAGAAAGARAVPAGRAGRRQTLERRAAMPARHAACDRQGAASCRAVVRFRPSAPRPDAWPGDRPPAGGDDDRRDAVRRPGPFRGRALWLSIFAD